jgi:3-hydroxyacyl-CoA dehydrogenase
VPVLNHQVRDRIALLSAAVAAPVPLDAALLQELQGALHAAQDDSGVEAMVLAGVFGAGPGTAPLQAPLILESVCAVIEKSAKPVLAALDGVLVGQGLELALACRRRIATPASVLGFPEVKTGLMPSAGSIERLVRLSGARATIEALTTGAFLSAEQAAAAGLLDALGADVLAVARGLAREPADQANDPADDPATGAAQFAQIRAQVAAKARGQLAPVRIVDAVEALCTQPRAQARERVRAWFDECRDGEQHRALVHAAAAQRAARTIPGLPPDTPSLPIRSAAVIGAGTMGGGIAMSFANAGIPVTLMEVTGEALERGMGLIRSNYEASVKRGSLTGARAAAALGLIRGTTEYAAVAAADIIVEAVFEDLRVKREVFSRLDEVAAPQAILATNTSTLDIDAIAASTSRPQQVVGTHFFSPANIMKLLENVRGRATSAQVISSVMALGQTLGKAAVLSGNADGFIGNRMLMFYGLEAEFLLEEGATPERVDRVMEEFGFAMGPLAVRDLAGNDVGLAIRRSRTLPPDERWSPILERMVAAGRLGQKAGKGFYRYEGRARVADPEALAIIAAVSRELGIAPRQIPDAEIRDRLLHPLVNAGAQLVEDGIALRSGDVDTVYINGYGFPAWRGGPMYWAESHGLERVVATARKLAALHGARWGPAPLLLRAAAQGHWP